MPSPLAPKFLPFEYQFLGDFREVRNLLVVVAMESEEKAVLGEETYRRISLGQRFPAELKVFELSRCSIRVAQSGVGLVNAGVLLALAVERFPVDAVIMLGVGGALDEQLEIGDWVVAERVLQHDSFASRVEGNRFIAPGDLTLSLDPNAQIDPIFRCDPVLVHWLRQTAADGHLGKTWQGTLLSGSEFVATPERKAILRSFAPDAWLVDMESAALAQLCRKLRIPFGVAKTVVDRARPAESVADDYLKFLDAAAGHGAAVLRGLLREFGE